MRKARNNTSSQNPPVIPIMSAAGKCSPGGRNAYLIGTCKRGRKRRLLTVESAVNETATAQAGHVPNRQTPSSRKDRPRFRNRNQSTTRHAHNTMAPSTAQSKKRCSGEPWDATGRVEISLETPQMASGIPRAKNPDPIKH